MDLAQAIFFIIGVPVFSVIMMIFIMFLKTTIKP